MRNNPLSFIILLFISFPLVAQNVVKQHNVVFYNVENLFDTRDNPETNDDEFTPPGERHWTNNRLNKKILQLSKAIIGVSGWESPAVIALCEVENRKVCEKLINNTPLSSKSYRIIHKESPDGRGIDVAFLYDSDVFYPLKYRHYPLRYPDGSIQRTREMLYVCGIFNQHDTLHFFVNHWPSRYSGLLETRANRIKAASELKKRTTQLLQTNPQAKIVILGDFNDQPTDESMATVLRALPPEEKINGTQLYNLSLYWKTRDYGTLKYRTRWFVFDQIIVSGNLLTDKNGIHTLPGMARIGKIDYLLEPDNTYGGEKPYRTYSGFAYNGGFSDHLPVILQLNAPN
jgi:endonuclease/exonuclease/phosphatase family metal-dependent hydrolase